MNTERMSGCLRAVRSKIMSNRESCTDTRFWRMFVGVSFFILIAIGFAGCSGQSKLPIVTVTPGPTELAFAQLSFDFTKSMLTPNDVADLFSSTTYSIQQQLKEPGMQGLMATYPTRLIEHTSGFAEGFATQIKTFADASRASRAYDAAVASLEVVKPLDLRTLGDASSAFEGTAQSPEGYELGSTEYIVLVRKGTFLVTITIRRNMPVPATRLGELAQIVLNRLNP